MYEDSRSYLFYVQDITIILLFKNIYYVIELLDRLYMLIYNIGETSCVNATKNGILNFVFIREL